MATKYCFVLSCLNNSKKDPDKHYVSVPYNKCIREKWCIAAGRPILSISQRSSAYCCSDHFNIETDFKDFDSNSSRPPKLKAGVIPFVKWHNSTVSGSLKTVEVKVNDHLKSMMDIHESTQDFRHLASKSTPQAISDDEMVLNYSDSEDDRSSKESKNDNSKEALDLLDKDNQMDVTDGDFPEKVHNGAAAFSETNSSDKQNDETDLIKSKYFQTAQSEDVEKLSLLDRFLSSEVVENGKESTTELIGDELVDESASEVIDENALLDEITNDLDQEDLDEECLMEDDIPEIVAKDDASTSTEVTSSKPDDESTILQLSDEKTADTAAENVADEKSDAVIESNEKTAEAEVHAMEVDDDEGMVDNCKPDSTEPSSEAEKENIELKVVESGAESVDNTLKIDEDNDNNLLEEMVDSPRSSEHESMTSELLEKDDTITRDSNDDEKMEQQLTVESSNENSNISESGATPEIDADVKDFKHDAEIHITDEISAIVETEVTKTEVVTETETKTEVVTETEVTKTEIVTETEVNNTEVVTETEVTKTEVVTEEMVVTIEKEFSSVVSPRTEIKVEEASADKPVDEEALSKNVDSDTTHSLEPPAKRKSDEDIDEPEIKKKRVEKVTSNNESVGSPQNCDSIGNVDDILELNDDDVVASTVEDVTIDDVTIDAEVSDKNKDDDDDVLIVGEIQQAEKSTGLQLSTATDIQEPVQKAKILILDTQAIANDLCEEPSADMTCSAESSIVPENDSEVSSSQEESTIEKVADPPVETTEPTLEPSPKAQTTLTLDPVPQKTLCPTAFSLNFVRKFQKNFDKMTRNDLEELLIQKCVEVIVHKSDYADMRNKIEKQESKLLSYSTKYQELSKQYRDLEMVHQRVVKDLEVKNQSVVTPVKITRAVGLQVSLPRKEITVQKPPPPQAAAVTQNIAQQNSALAKNRRKAPPQRPNEPTLNAQQQQQQQQQQLIRQNNILARRTELQLQQRNQFHLQQQQQQQQQGQNNLLKQQLIQNNNPNNLRQQANIRKPASQFSPVSINQLQNASPKTPGSADRPRVPPVILKKMTPTRMVTVNNSSGSTTTAVYSSQSKIANTSITRSPATTTSMNNLIDLTDEEDSKRVAQNGTNPPALVAIPNNQGNKTVVGQGKVNFVTLKPGQPQAQLQMVQQNRLASMHKVGGAYVPIAPKSNGTTGQIVQLRKQQQPATTLTAVQRRQHPAPLPYPNNQPTNPYWKLIPPRPIIRISNIESGIVISWTMDEMTDKHAEVASYQIYAYQETSAAPSPETWRHVGDVKAMLLPMAVTLTQFQEGQRYHFAVRAVDEHSRYGIFSLPKTWT